MRSAMRMVHVLLRFVATRRGILQACSAVLVLLLMRLAQTNSAGQLLTSLVTDGQIHDQLLFIDLVMGVLPYGLFVLIFNFQMFHGKTLILQRMTSYVWWQSCLMTAVLISALGFWLLVFGSTVGAAELQSHFSAQVPSHGAATAACALLIHVESTLILICLLNALIAFGTSQIAAVTCVLSVVGIAVVANAIQIPVVGLLVPGPIVTHGSLSVVFLLKSTVVSCVKILVLLGLSCWYFYLGKEKMV